MSTSARQDKLNRQLTVLLRDHGYKMDGSTLMTIPIRRFDRPEVVGTFDSLMRACEYLIPIVREDDFSDRYRKFTTSD